MVRVLDRLSPSQARPLAVLVLCAIACCTIAIIVGAVGALSYGEGFKGVGGLTLQHLRPLHTTFGIAWIYLAGCTVVYFFLFCQEGQRSKGFRLRLKGQLLLWSVAGVGVLVTLCRGVFSGREYLGGHWAWSVLIYVGWILFAWNFFSVVGFSLRGKPAFVYMWYTSLLLFLWAFAEGHAWHLHLVGDYPVRDIAIQWKSYGPLVGSFNLLVYGALGYVGCCLARDFSYSHSNTAFFLLFLGLFNSFTNFAHHTYHLPQSHLVKWISCVVSLAEVLLVAKYLIDLCIIVRRRHDPSGNAGVGFLMTMTTVWSLLLVGVAVLISVPPLNTLIHGTHFVMAHAMGMMLGIDSMALWATLLYVIHRVVPTSHHLAKPRFVVVPFLAVNVGILLLVALLSAKGLITGYLRYLGPAAPAPPQFLAFFPQAFIALGIFLAFTMLLVNLDWALSLVPFAFRATTPDFAIEESRLETAARSVVTPPVTSSRASVSPLADGMKSSGRPVPESLAQET